MRPQIYLTSKPVFLTALRCHVLCCLEVCPSTAARPLQLRSQTGPSCLAHRGPQSIENFPDTHTEHTAHAPCTFTNRHTHTMHIPLTDTFTRRQVHTHTQACRYANATLTHVSHTYTHMHTNPTLGTDSPRQRSYWEGQCRRLVPPCRGLGTCWQGWWSLLTGRPPGLQSG